MLPLFDDAPAPRADPLAFVLDGDERPRSHRPPPVRPGHPCYVAYWTAFNRGADGQSAPGEDADEHVRAYVKSGYRIGRLFRRLPCMKEKQ